MADDVDPRQAGKFGRDAEKSMAGFSASLRAAQERLGALKKEMRESSGQVLNWGQVAEAAVSKFKEALKKGDAEGVQKYKKALNELRIAMPEAFAAGSEAAREFDKACRTTFSGTVEQAATAGARINNLVNAYVELGIASKEQGKAAVAGAIAAQGSMYHLEGAMNELRELEMERRGAQSRGIDTSAIEERIAQKKIALSEKTKNTTIAGQLQMKAVAEKSSQGLSSLLSKDASALGGLAKAAVDSGGAVGTVMKSIMRTEALGAAGVAATGASAGAAAVGSNLIAALGASLGPIAAAMGGVALISRIVIGAFSRIGRESAVAGGQMRAMAMNGKSDMGLFNLSMGGSISRIERFAGYGGMMGAAMSQAFKDDILPAAQKTLLTFNTLDRSKDTIDEWAGALAGAAIDGQSMGFSYEKSMGMIVKQASVFGGSARQAREGFRSMAMGALQAHTTTEQLEESLGGLESWAERFGRGGGQGTGGIFAEVGRKVSMSGVEGAERNMMMRSVAGMISNVPMMLGLGTSAMGQSKIFERYVGAVRAKDSGSELARLQGEVALGAINGKGFGGPGGMSAGDTIRNSNDAQAIWSAAQYAGTLTGISPDAMMRPEFLKKFESFLGAGGDKNSKEYVKLRGEAAAISGDMTTQGMTSIVQQQDLLKDILSTIDRIAELLGTAISSATFGAIRMRPPVREDLSKSTKHLF